MLVTGVGRLRQVDHAGGDDRTTSTPTAAATSSPSRTRSSSSTTTCSRSVEQREVGVDVPNFPRALRAALRQDPDIILVGEMRDIETIDTAIKAAETGHLVFSTLHTTDATKTINRIIDTFPPHQQQQVRYQLAVEPEGGRSRSASCRAPTARAACRRSRC